MQTCIRLWFGGFLLLNLIGTPLQAQIMPNPDAAQLQASLKKLTVIGSVLYIAAHPDDENTAVLAYCANHRLLRTGYLALTRGDGGQNLIGTEQSELLGIIRTQELLAARRMDGADQFFTRAIDFGYTKSSEETFTIWDRQKVLSDVVWVIRSFKPDIIITRFPSTGEGGHGQHTASAILAQEAFSLAADPSQFPEQLKYVEPWQAKRIFWNAWLPALQERKADLSKLIRLDIGDYDPLLGKSYTELAAESRSMHKSQGFGVSGQRAETLNYFDLTQGEPAANDLFDGIDLSWSRIPGGKEVGAMLDDIYRKFNPENPSASIPQLIKAYRLMNQLPDNVRVIQKQKELREVIRSCAGIWMEAIADDYAAAPGDQIKITAAIINRTTYPLALQKINFPFQTPDTLAQVDLRKGKFVSSSNQVTITSGADYTQPYWIVKEPTKGMFEVDDQKTIGSAENPSALYVEFIVKADGELLSFPIPVLYRWTDPVKGERYRPFVVVPSVAVNIEEKVYLFSSNNPKTITLTLKSGAANVNGDLRLRLPVGWTSSPESIPFELKNKYDETKLQFSIQPPASNSDGFFTAEATVNGKMFTQSIQSIQYDHIPIQTLFPPAKAKLIRLDIQTEARQIGYIMGSGDQIPEYLSQLGINVKLIGDEELERGQFEAYDAIVAGIRAYNTRPRLKFAQNKLMRYVENGGTLIVQYNTPRGLAVDNIGPYPFKITSERVTFEDAPIGILLKDHVVMRFPNLITNQDFSGWVQERGLYFANPWDAKYETVFSSNDPGETAKNGGMLFTRYGKGVFIYSGYSWFRQLPAGVPGAYKIFVNMISSGKAK